MGWVKCNSDGASRNNLDPSSATFCLRDHNKNMVGAKRVVIPYSKNLVAEAFTIRKVLQYTALITISLN